MNAFSPQSAQTLKRFAAGLARLARVRSSAGFPSGKDIIERRLPILARAADVPGAGDVERMAGEAYRCWSESGAPVWWVSDALCEDLISTPLPTEIKFNEVPWPFPSFALVTRTAISLCAFPGSTGLDPSTGETFNIGIVSYVDMSEKGFIGSAVTNMRDTIGGIEDLSLFDWDLSAQQRAAETQEEHRRRYRLLVGAALLLSTHTVEELQGTVAGASPEHMRLPNPNDTVEPPWLHEALRRHKAPKLREAPSTGTTKSPHWRRAHWRLQRVGEGRTERRMTWVRHTLVGDEA